LVSAPQGTPTNPSLFCDTFSLLQKRKDEGVHCFIFWTSLLPTTVLQERTFETLAKNKGSTIFERYHPNHVYRMPIPSYWWRQNFRGGCAQQRLETGLPSESPSVFPLYQWHWQVLDRAESEVLPLLWIQFRSLIVIMHMTLLSLQTQLNAYSSN
jgi:hypothetical protein